MVDNYILLILMIIRASGIILDVPIHSPEHFLPDLSKYDVFSGVTIHMDEKFPYANMPVSATFETGTAHMVASRDSCPKCEFWDDLLLFAIPRAKSVAGINQIAKIIRKQRKPNTPVLGG